MFQNSIKTLIPKLNPKPWLKEVKVLLKHFFYVPRKKRTTKRKILLMLRLMKDAYGLPCNIDK
jgi:hypothetical protein